MMIKKTGSALPMVLFFTAIASVAVTIYVYSQFFLNKPLLKSPAELQALLNARSGAWIGLSVVNGESGDGHARATDSLDELFGADLFEKDEPEDSGETADLLSGDTIMIDPFGDSLFGLCSVFITPSGGFRSIHSAGTFRNFDKYVAALVGSKPFLCPDTVLYLQTPGLPEGGGRIDGKIGYIAFDVDSTGGRRVSKLAVVRARVEEFVDEYQSELSMIADTMIQDQPLVVKSNSDISEIDNAVNSHLFIDGTYHDIEWREKRRILVLGDLQFTGDVSVKDVEFIVAGEIRVFDKARLSSVAMFSQSRIFFADDAVFGGSAVALGDVEIYGNAAITDRSAVITVGSTKGSSGLSEKGTAPVKQHKEGEAKDEDVQPKNKRAGKQFTLFIRDRATVDGAVINLNGAMGIQTDVETEIMGVLWAEGRVCHQGVMRGVVKAKTLVSIDDPNNVSKNVMTGSVEPLEDIDKYYLPYFIGEMSIISWKED